MKAFIFIVLVLGQACASKPPAPTCAKQLRAVIDLGSGSTKMNMAEVDLCGAKPVIQSKIERDDSRAVALEASKNLTGEIPAEARAQALAALVEFRDIAKGVAHERGFTSLHLAVVGTHALRTATNRDVFLSEIQGAGFTVRALTQEEEARAGYQAVLASPIPEDCSKDNVLVWDTGGGSTQFTRSDGENPLFKNFPLGAENFRKSFLTLKTRTKNKVVCPVDPESPNPLGKNIGKAQLKVAGLAPVKASDLKTAQACTIGIGGVHNKAVRAQIQKHWRAVSPCVCGKKSNCTPTPDGYSKKELQCLATFLAYKSDCADEIKGPFARTAVSNLAMVLGFMDQLKIERVRTLPINMGDHYLSDAGVLTFTPVAAP